ncbi:MAG: type I restriction endonuclease subunit R, partial [Proteobacteria bacterium]|nr:type I restriction endonuclease subunit R [Pseudomonadota bacterium]
MTFTEANTVESFLRDLLCSLSTSRVPAGTAEPETAYGTKPLPPASMSSRWRFVPSADLPRKTHEVFVEPFVIEALTRLNPEIAADPDRAEQVLHKMRAIVLSVRSDGLIAANERFTEWLRGDQSMPFGKDGEHTT